MPNVAAFQAFCAQLDPQILYNEINQMDEDRKKLEERLVEYSSNLEELYNTRAERDEARVDLLALLKQQVSEGNTSKGRFQEVKVEAFDGDTKKLKAFLFNMATKMQTEKDLYENDTQAQLRCYITHLVSKARTQVENYIEEDGSINLSSVEELITLLKTAFGDVDEMGTAQRKITTLKQGNRALIEFIAEWQALAAKTKFGDVALIFMLKGAIHPVLLRRLTLSPYVTSTWLHFVDLVRQADVQERVLDSNYHTKGTEAKGGKNHTPSSHTNAQTPPLHNDPMDLSAAKVDISKIGWGKNDETKRPVTDDQKMAKRVYCMVNGLCNWCYSKEHRGDLCPTAIWNKSKSFYTGKKEGNASS